MVSILADEVSLNATKKKKLCLKCQACCKLLYVPMKRPNEADREFYEARGCTFELIKGVFHIIIPSVCPQLTKEGCKIYDTRPQACRGYDGREDPLLKSICLWDKENRDIDFVRRRFGRLKR